MDTETHRIEILSAVSADNGQPVIVYRWGDQRGQFSPAEARRHALALLAAAEAAMADASLWTTSAAMGLDERTAAAFVRRVRDARAQCRRDAGADVLVL
jgi:hypothetical protein